MSLFVMPLLVVNLGSEMVYILDQRLKAQNIPGDKGVKVLRDVVTTMFDATYVEKLFTPQEMYTVSSTRKIFDRLAHSSIMRLSESSMDKLFDLMLMGCKYQLVCATKLDSIVEVAQLHLTTLRSMLSSIPEVQPLITNVEEHVNRTYRGMGLGQLHLLRQTLLRFFQDKRVKVSLFLQEGIQSSVGRLLVPSPVTALAGTVTCFDLSGGLESQEKFKLKAAEIDANEFFIHPCPLGTNLYNKDRAKVVPPPRKGDLITGPVKADDDSKAPYTDQYVDKGGKGARQELELLSALLAIKPPPSDNFKLNLFDEEGLGSGGKASGVPTMSFGAKDTRAGGLASVIQNLNIDDKGGQQEEADLLDLLDAAK